MAEPRHTATTADRRRSPDPRSAADVAPTTNPAASTLPASTPSKYHFVSDLHIGGDGVLDHCDFEDELIGFLRGLESEPGPAELIIIGDGFGLWELTQGRGPEKLDRIAATHQPLFDQFRRTGRHVTITLLPGNHDYDLACYPAYVDRLAEYNIRLDPHVHTERRVGQRKIWVEHGNQHDSANTFPDFGNPYGQPVGYFITADVVGVSGRRAGRSRSAWLGGLQEKDQCYVDAARTVFAADPSVALFIYGHTHAVSARQADGRYIINTGTWLKRLQRVQPWFGWLPPVFVPSFRLNYFVVSTANGGIRVQYHVVPKPTPRNLTLLQRIMTLGRKPPGSDAIPPEIVIGGDSS